MSDLRAVDQGKDKRQQFSAHSSQARREARKDLRRLAKETQPLLDTDTTSVTSICMLAVVIHYCHKSCLTCCFKCLDMACLACAVSDGVLTGCA